MLYVVQSVPSRRELRRRLLEAIPPAVVIEDDGPPPPNPWRGYQLCIQAFLETSHSHAVIVQDDTLVCRNFDSAVEKIAEANPNTPVCLFVSGHRSHTQKRYLQAMNARKPYSQVWFQDFCPVVAMIWPRAQAQEFLEWSKDAKLPGLPNPRSDDAVVGSWMKFTKQKIFATVPSLVEHPDDCESHSRQKISYGKDKGRRACWYIGGADPLEIDWSLV